MALGSDIEWTESTWNPVTGCTKVSPGCAHCYAERMARRLCAMGQPNYRNGFAVTTHPHTLALPLGWRAPQVIFVNSMSDLFHPEVPDEFVHQVFDIMRRADWHTFQVLTKRADRLATMAPQLPWPPNVWVGVSVENEAFCGRIDHLRQVPAAVRFVSFEPLLGSVGTLNLDGINWAIVGGESGPGARPMSPEWAIAIRDQCVDAGIPFFFKQWGGVRKRQAGRHLDGRLWNQWPVIPCASSSSSL